jgi:hypothetical protein
MGGPAHLGLADRAQLAGERRVHRAIGPSLHAASRRRRASRCRDGR